MKTGNFNEIINKIIESGHNNNFKHLQTAIHTNTSPNMEHYSVPECDMKQTSKSIFNNYRRQFEATVASYNYNNKKTLL